MKKNTVYIPLQGRIGNQLFQYAVARKMQCDLGPDAEIVIDDSDVLRCNWVNSLVFYNLPNVTYVHDGLVKKMSKQYFLRKIYRLFTRNKDYIKKYKMEKKLLRFFNRQGMFICENGYLEANLNYDMPIYLEGYFQSEKYFINIKDDIFSLLKGEQFPELKDYPGVDEIRNRNSVCISVKVEHNVGSSMYSVCDMNYWKESIKYIEENVENPLFFVCSDNVQYVIDHLIDTSKFDYVVQCADYPVHVSLAAMSECKHFIIGNTTFGWWAQYLSSSEEKIVVAPSRWMNIDMPIDIYQDNWHCIKV